MAQTAIRACSRARTLAASAILLAGLACQAPAPDIPPMPGSASVDSRPARVIDRGALPVRLARHEGEHGVQIEGATGGARWLEVERDAVRSSDGTRSARFEFEPESKAAGLTIDGRVYSGTLVVEPRPSGGLRVTNRVPLEDYVEGVVAAELVLWSAEPAELEAQAVAARTYALVSLARDGHERFLWDDTRDQAYRGRFRPANDGERRVAERLSRAVAATRGRVLVRHGDWYDARFHASCGGHTATLGDVFPAESLIFDGDVPCAPCREVGRAELVAGATSGRVAWSARFPNEEVDRLARELRVGNRLASMRVARTDAHGRWLALEVTGDAGRRSVGWNEVRRRLGAGVLKGGVIVDVSPRADEPVTDGARFVGVGRGHGVGLCQIGAHELASQGWSSDRILAHYYPLATIATVTDVAP